MSSTVRGCLMMTGPNSSYDDFLDGDDARGRSKLEQALKGQSSEVILRVRAYARAFDLDDNDELYAFAAALGLLTVLVEDAPEQWRALFDEFIDELNQWAQQNRLAFDQLQSHARTVRQLSELLQQALQTFRTSGSRQQSLQESVLSTLSANTYRIKNLDSAVGERLNQADRQLAQMQKQNRVTTILAGVGVGVSCLVLLLGGLSSRQLAQQNRELRQVLAWQQEKVGWVLEKANREECLNGVKPQSDPQCQQFF